MTFLKNIQFTHLLKIDGQLKEFNFRKPNGSLETIFTVDTLNEAGNRVVFNMQHTGNEWTILQSQLPAWLVASENQLAASIKKELAIQEIYFVKPAPPHFQQLNKLFHRFRIGY